MALQAEEESAGGSQPKRERLEVGVLSEKERALRSCAVRLNAQRPAFIPPGEFTQRAQPSSILARLQDFLPKLAAANQELDELPLVQRNHLRLDLSMDGNVAADDLGVISLPNEGPRGETTDLDNAMEGPSPEVVMDLACGILDLKSPEAVEAAQRVASSGNSLCDPDRAPGKTLKRCGPDDFLEHETAETNDTLSPAVKVSSQEEGSLLTGRKRARGIVEL